ncbi:MAG: hypothetical protein IPJ76_12320 [Flavobacteriales bacterium]|nr:MAG: hypothetical protein IPJ76_12320 [Flavobacteriales bacterium]
MDNASAGLRQWYRISLFFLAAAATIGALLRLIYVVDMPWLIFKPWLHAHSHVAMLGWVFPGLIIALLALEDRRLPKGMNFWFTLSMALVAGMLVSFPVQGYGELSIACSVGQMIVGYVMLAQVWAHTRHWPARGSRLLVRLAIVFQYLSTLGIWAMGPIMTSKLAGTEWYYWSIQWFLHFQFNGWFWFAAMAIGSRWAERQGVDVRLDTATTLLWATGTVLTFALAIAWSERFFLVLMVNSLGVVLQVVAAWRTLQAMRKARLDAYVRTTPLMRVLIGVLFLSMAVKVAAQALVAVPMVANMALTLRNYVMGFVHLSTLGAATALLFSMALMKGWLNEASRWTRAGILLFIAGYACSELLLFVQGTCFWAGFGLLPGYYISLFAVSAVLATGVWLLFVAALGRGGSGLQERE